MYKPTITYIPGVCNIGPEEKQRRLAIGWVGLLVTIIIAGLLLYFPISHWLRIFLFLPATMSATGFVQAHFNFCFAFGKKGIFNMDHLGTERLITDPESLKKDRHQANIIISYSLVIGIIITIIAVFI
jgi:uncharacterized membrane protein YkgB